VARVARVASRLSRLSRLSRARVARSAGVAGVAGVAGARRERRGGEGAARRGAAARLAVHVGWSTQLDGLRSWWARLGWWARRAGGRGWAGGAAGLVAHVVELVEVALGARVDVELLGPLDEGVCRAGGAE